LNVFGLNPKLYKAKQQKVNLHYERINTVSRISETNFAGLFFSLFKKKVQKNPAKLAAIFDIIKTG
jgi:hypothetical protein